ncbi:MAG: Myotubularin-related protein 6, partial [Paramarteilia canceri]
ILIEKEWCAFSHKFPERCKHGSPVVKVKNTSKETINEDFDKFRTANGESLSVNDEFSPVFLLFLNCCFQIITQFPEYFEFNQNLLTIFAREVFLCLSGNFIAGSFKERASLNLTEKTDSLWTKIKSVRTKIESFVYNKQPNNPFIFPSTKSSDLRIWNELYFAKHPTQQITNMTIEY